MPGFKPFVALRYAVDDLSDVIAPPYDVLSDADVDALSARSEHNIVRVDVPRGGSDRYTDAGRTLQRWCDEGVLVADPTPSFTIYRMRFTDSRGIHRDIAGVLGGLEVVDEGAGGVLPHERTTPKASTDRLDLTRATDANLSPVWGLSLARGLTDLLAAPGELLGEVVVDGVQHVVERVDDPARVAAIRALLASDDVLIADGHHRYGISRIYRDERRSRDGATGPAEFTLAFVNELISDQLSIEPIHRVYSGVSAAEVSAALSEHFDLQPTDAPDAATLTDMIEQGYLVLVTATGASRLIPRPGGFHGVRELDGAWLETAMAGVPAMVTYQHGLDDTLAQVRSGAASAAVLIRPVSLAEIERTAREGVLMPPKSTFFTPKLRTGLVIRPMG